MKKIITVLIAIVFLISTYDIRLKSNYVLEENNRVSLIEKIDEQTTDVKQVNARYLRSLMDHAVKISESVTALDGFGSLNIYRSSGSGSVIAVDELSNSSVILTVHHVCDMVKVGTRLGSGVAIAARQDVITSKGEKLKVKRVLYKDANNDICVVESEGIAGVPADPAAFYPERGSVVHSVGAPVGIWDDNVVNVVDGYFVGIRKKSFVGVKGRFEGFVQWSMPIVGGMSGSAVFYRGRIVGLISHVSSRFNNVGWGPGLGQVRKATELGLQKWRDSL